jgi:ATP-dependent Clp protease protease subunit
MSSHPASVIKGLRESEEKARDLGLVPRDLPRAEDDDDWNYYVIPNPMVIEETEHGSQRYDLYSRLLKDRIIFMGRDIDDRVANLITAQLLFLETQEPDKDINFYINSPGGVISAGMGVYDTMQFIRCDVATVCIGQAASMGSFLLLAGAKGKRNSLPHARIMIHQPLGGARGTVTDLQIQYKEMMHVRDMVYGAMAKHTGKTFEEVVTACDRDNFMSPQEAKDFGIIDNIVDRRAVPASAKK